MTLMFWCVEVSSEEVSHQDSVKMKADPWLTHVNVWQKPLQYCKVISLQLIKTNGGKKKGNKKKRKKENEGRNSAG